MKTSTKYSVSDAATLYKKSRATIYKDIKNGTLSRDQDGSIDFSELLRVYGEPFNGKHSKRIDTSLIQNTNTPEYSDNTVVELKNQIEFLKKQLEKAEDREAKANNRIDTLLTLIEMKPSKVNNESDRLNIEKESPPISNDITTDPPLEDIKSIANSSTETKRIPVPEQIELELPTRGFLSRFFLPNG